MTEVRVACPVNLNQETGRDLMGEALSQNLAKKDRLVLDFSRTTAINSLGAAWLMKIGEAAQRRETEIQWEGQQGEVAEFMVMVAPGLLQKPIRTVREGGLLESIGNGAYNFVSEMREFLRLCVDAIYWTILAPFEGRGFRWELLIDEIHEMGVRAVRIVCLMNFLLGLIIAMLSAKQVETFGLQIYVADLLMIAFARELAAIMTAIVVSARTGAAIAAELATMQVQEEIDALRGMGLNVTQFLVTPKLLALLIVLPCLVALGMVSGVAGGMVWGIFVLKFQFSVWYQETYNAAHLQDMFEGMLKTLFFAIAIVLIGCHNGFRVRGGSRGVGLMTTRAVVQDIFMLIVIDIIFAAVFYYILK